MERDKQENRDSQEFEFATDAFAGEVPTDAADPVDPFAELERRLNPARFSTALKDDERRQLPRAAYEVTATLSVESEDGSSSEVMLYTRDVNSAGSGFLAPMDVFSAESATNAPATIAIPSPDGEVRHVRCQLKRAREIGDGWVEGYVSFEEPASVFSSKRINAAHAEGRKPIFAGA